MISALLFAAALGGSSCLLAEAQDLELADGRLRLGQVIDGDCPLLAEMDDLVIARLPQGTNRLSLSRAALVALIRRRVPDLAIDDPSTGPDIELQRPLTTNAQRSCFALSRAVTADAPLTEDAIVATTCLPEQARFALAYDRRDGIVRAAEAGEAGRYIGPLMALPPALIERNQDLQLRVTQGPVTITRDVVAVQTVRAGDAIFVRDADHHVFAAPSSAGGRR